MSKPLLFIFITLLIDVTGLGIILPVLPELVQQVGNVGLSEATEIGGLMLFTYAGMQFLFAPVIGNLGDRFGRRPVLLLSLFTFGLDCFLLAWAPSLMWLFIARAISGIAGASFTVAASYIADISTPEKRAANFGLIGAAFGVGFVLGPVIGGFLGELGPRVPFFVAGSIALANVVFGYLVLPESLPKEKRRPFNILRANPFGAFSALAASALLTLLASAVLLREIAGQVYPSTWSYFTIERFDFSPSMIGLSLGAFGILYAFVNAWLVRKIMPVLGEIKTLIAGMIITIFTYMCFALVTNQTLFWFILIPACLSGLMDPPMRGLMANLTDDDKQGELQGAMTSLSSLGAIIGPLMLTQTFSYFTTPASEGGSSFYFPGAAFALSCCIMIVVLVPITIALTRFGLSSVQRAQKQD